MQLDVDDKYIIIVYGILNSIKHVHKSLIILRINVLLIIVNHCCTQQGSWNKLRAFEDKTRLQEFNMQSNNVYFISYKMLRHEENHQISLRCWSILAQFLLEPLFVFIYSRGSLRGQSPKRSVFLRPLSQNRVWTLAHKLIPVSGKLQLRTLFLLFLPRVSAFGSFHCI